MREYIVYDEWAKTTSQPEKKCNTWLVWRQNVTAPIGLVNTHSGMEKVPWPIGLLRENIVYNKRAKTTSQPETKM